MTAIVAPLLLLLLSQGYTAPGQGTPPCEVSTDSTYGYTRDNPIQIGGGALYVKAREQRYLNALRGPTGEALSYKRRGSLEGPKWGDRITFLDEYEVTYTGLEKPLLLYLDAYRYWEHRAPAGFTCAEPFNLPPLIDSFLASESLLALALEQRGGAVAPIPLDADGTATHGVMWDAFRLLVATNASNPQQAKPVPPGTLVFAYPRMCDGRPVNPTDVEIISAQGSAVTRMGIVVADATVNYLVPGFSPPAGSIASRFQLQQMRPADRIRITYAEPCAGARELMLTMKFTQAKSAQSPPPPLPEGGKPGETRVLMQVMIDLEGRLQRPQYAGGPSHLQAAAIEAVKAWRAEPARINGAPVPTAMLVLIPFK
jgi:hypothetical protein